MSPKPEREPVEGSPYETVRSAGPRLIAIQRELFDAGFIRTAKCVSDALKNLGWETETLAALERLEQSK